ncbi:MG2 domain-containing protein [Thalassoglobus sp. JC818]|uniref:alpha-2-macroglobulin family protein n=1 Tax=Thalassoglobus sp. JC818 TaxID=3232136 RepID=UPI003457893D
MSRPTFAVLLLFLCGVSLLGVFRIQAQTPNLEQQRSEAAKLFKDGQYKEALTIFVGLVKSEENSGATLAYDLKSAANCYRKLQQMHELDDLLAVMISTHPEDWRGYWTAAQELQIGPSNGVVVAGEFRRGNQRGGGEYASVEDRDRVQSLRWMMEAKRLMPTEVTPEEQANFYEFFASIYADGRLGTHSWLLQDSTSLEELPEPEIGYQYNYRSRKDRAAPVDENGQPIFFTVPSSLEDAKSDGERWRWCLQQAAEQDPSRKARLDFNFAEFARSQFGVPTLRRWGIDLSGLDSKDEASAESKTWQLPTLGEDETIARLATGTLRFKLPEDYDFIGNLRKISESDNKADSERALLLLAQVFEDRLQYDTAAEVWKLAIERHGPGRQNYRQNRLDQIVNNWGQFESVQSQASGVGAKIDYRFRNGDLVHFAAQEIKVPELIKDIQIYLKTSPKELDWQKLQVENIGYRLVSENETKYLGKTVAAWSVDLEPRENHFDRRTTISTPLQNAGAYLLTAKMNDGNTSRIIIWLDNTAIVKKQLNGRSMYFVADATTGEPLNKIPVEFFGWKQEQVPNTVRDYAISVKQHAEFTNEDGVILADEKLLSDDMRWMAIVQTDDKRFAYLGFSGVWYGDYQRSRYDQQKVYVVTDRPVYRPEQKVEFKFWMREVTYEKTDAERFANQEFTVRISDPQGTEVFKQRMTTDKFGGLAGSYDLPEGATLGNYYLSIDHERGISGGNSFRVEEYKKPEFEVTIDAPQKPVALGEPIQATISARYFFGAPVTNAKVQFKVERSKHDSRWFPVTRWDWLYGSGFWWFASEYQWYPGFSRWGSLPPIPGWWNWNPDPPELVLDQEVEIGPDGTVQVDIDTSLAKALHGDSDHEYKITAEVTDASRRTIVGSGSVLVAREPFKVFAWTTRGHYSVGNVVDAEFQARTVDGQGVQGTGSLKLQQISYDENGIPQEKTVEEWELNTDEDGKASQKINAQSAGQYRLSYSVTADDKTIEGACLFVIRGAGFDGSDFRFNDLELVLNKQTYSPGEEIELLVNTNRIGSTVLLFVRAENGLAPAKPQILRLDGKSTVVPIEVVDRDMPNFFIEAITISNGELHTAVQEVVVPPQDRIINVEILTETEKFRPGQQADIQVKFTDDEGKPFEGSLVMSVYDRAVEYISGGSNVTEIREFFWKWKRNHYPNSEHNLSKYFGLLTKSGEILMGNIGIFGGEVADTDKLAKRKLELADGAPQGRGGRLMSTRAMPAPMSAAGGEVAESMVADFAAEAPAEAEMVAPTVRTNFADTAFWKADLSTNHDGIAEVSFTMPENLSSWKMRAWGLGEGTAVGEATTEVVTSKDFVVRLQAPRFFVEKDEVVISAVVHNYLETAKQAEVSLDLSGDTLKFLSPDDQQQTVQITAGGEARIDWRVKAVAEGTATITAQGLTDEESDAMKMSFPVYLHGFEKFESFAGVIRPEDTSDRIVIVVPEERRPEQTRLEIRYSPTLAGAMVDALPYLAEYPYGCTEQTLNRFVPTVITQGILRRMGLNLAEIKEKRTNLNAQEIGDPNERATRWKHFDRNPVFDEAELTRMVKKGVQDLTSMQNSDGGWGWFSGYGERSYPHTTAVVVHGLQQAAKNDIAIVDGIIEKGIAWLTKYQLEQVELLEEGDRQTENPSRKRHRTQASNLDALIFSVLVDAGEVNQSMQNFLYRDRLKLSLYGQALTGLALDKIGANEQRDMIVRNIDQFVTVDDENQTAYIDLPNNAYWWNWYGSSIEANAQYLKLLCRIAPQAPKTSGLVKFILNNRKHGSYWTNTRDTAYCIEALAEYLEATNELKPDMTVEVFIDGERKQSVEITSDNLFTFENAFVIEGADLTSGEHTIELRKSGTGPLYHNAYLTNFSLEDFITKAGLEVKVQRTFYRLVQDESASSVVSGSRGQVVDQKSLKYDRVLLENLSDVKSGDLIEVELEIDSKNDYEYVIFEDLKAAGTEPVDLRSGYTSGGLGAYVEFRDERVAFFMRTLERGKHSVSYRLRAEIPGQFSALPARAYAMYAPELRGNSDEFKLIIEDTE